VKAIEKRQQRRGRLFTRFIRNLFDERECGGCPKWLVRGTAVCVDRRDNTHYCSVACARATIMATQGEEAGAA
jgi:hypothetical protein